MSESIPTEILPLSSRSVAAMPEVPYATRMLPWGKTGSQWEKYLSDIDARPYWLQRRDAIKKEKKCDIQEACHEAMLELHPGSEKLIELERLAKEAGENRGFVAAARAGFSMVLPAQANIEQEIKWIGANMNKPVPHLESCPSYWALGYIIEAREDDVVRRNFYSTALSKRLSPGDGKVKPKKSITVDEDDDSQAEAHEEELRKRLFG